MGKEKIIMRVLLKIFLIILFVGNLYAQLRDTQIRLGEDGISVLGSSLVDNRINLTPNTDTVWTGNYFPLAVATDTVRYASVTSVQATVWRRNTDRTFDRIGITDNLFSSIVDSAINDINITPIPAKAGDYYGWRIIAGGVTYEGISLSSASRIGVDGNITKVKFWYDDGIPFKFCQNDTLFFATYVGYYNDSIAYCDSAIQKITNKDFRTGTVLDISHNFPIHFYTTPAPCISVTGTSHSDSWHYYRSWADPNGLATYDYKATIDYMLASIFQKTVINTGRGGDLAQVIHSRYKQDVTDKKVKLSVFDGVANNSGNTINFIRLEIKGIIDSNIAKGIDCYYLETFPMQSRDNATWQIFDSVDLHIKQLSDTNTAVHYIKTRAKLGQFRVGGAVGNLWDLKAGFNTDETHVSTSGYELVVGVLCDTLDVYYIFPTDTTTVQYEDLTPLADTLTLSPLDSIVSIVRARYCRGIDSLKVAWNRNNRGDTTVTMTNHYANNANDSFKTTWAIPNLVTGDNVQCRYYIYAHHKTTITPYNTFHVIAPIVPDSGLIIAYDFESDKGFGKSLFASKVVNLVNKADTLTMHNASDSGTFVKFTGNADSYAQQTSKLTTSAFTVVMKFRSYPAQTGYRLFWSYSALANLWGMTRETDASSMTAAYWAGGGLANYYTQWGMQEDDSVTAWTADGKIYRNGILRTSNPMTPSGADVSALFTLMSYFDGQSNNVNGRLYYSYVYNRVLSQAEIALFK